MPRGLAAARSDAVRLARDRADRRPSDHGPATSTSWPRGPQRRRRPRRASATSISSRPGCGAARVERAREVRGVEGGRVDRLLQVHAAVDDVEEAAAATTGPAGRRPGVPKAIQPSPSRSASDGDSVVRGRTPPRERGRQPLLEPEHLRRACRGRSRARGPSGEDCSQPPLGVAETMLPVRSTTSTWQVSPTRRLAARPAPTASRRPARGRPRPGSRGAAAPPRRARAAAPATASSPISARRSAAYAGVEQRRPSGAGAPESP